MEKIIGKQIILREYRLSDVKEIYINGEIIKTLQYGWEESFVNQNPLNL